MHTIIKRVFHADPGHGWLEVPRSELARLGILDRITRYSYQSRDGATVYLEEDCDLSTYCRAAGIEPSALDCMERSYNYDAPIRYLPMFRP